MQKLKYIICATLISLALCMDYESRLVGQWHQLTQTCPDRSYISCESIDRSKWTHVKSTRLKSISSGYSGLGKLYEWQLETYTESGQKRTGGGDSWFVIMRDREQKLKLPVRVIDQGDGTYSLIAALSAPGHYHINAMLWCSDCHGFMEPTYNSSEGRSRLDELQKVLKKVDHCYIGARVHWPVFVKGWTDET